MIDRIARNKLAEEIRHFLGCFKDNFEYDDAVFDIKTEDYGVIDIRQNIWLTYDDLRKHKMEGAWALSPEQSDIIKRCIVFLKSDVEYNWPKWPLYYKAARPILFLISYGILTKTLDNHFNGGGAMEVWPFFSSEEYEYAKAHPVYCSNTHNTSLQPTSGRDAAFLG